MFYDNSKSYLSSVSIEGIIDHKTVVVKIEHAFDAIEMHTGWN